VGGGSYNSVTAPIATTPPHTPPSRGGGSNLIFTHDPRLSAERTPMHHSPLYQKAFQRYLRYGHSPELQIKTALDANSELLSEKIHDAPAKAETIVAALIRDLEAHFKKHGRDWPDIPPPNTEEMEKIFIFRTREMLENLATDAEAMLPEDFAHRLQRSENFMAARFRQNLAATVQPHYGVESFIWDGGDGDNSCDNCAAHSGQTFAWNEDGGPPGCLHCVCTATPSFRQPPPPLEPPLDSVYPELLLAPLRILRPLLGIPKPKPESAKPVEKPGTSKPSVNDKPKNVPKDWKQVPSKKGDGTKYVDPKNKHNDVRVQKGKPENTYPSQQKDYVTWKRNGQYMDKNGNSVPRESPEAHIPIDEFDFKPEIFK